MLTFIFGGSASGKSEYAEQYAASWHIAAMPLFFILPLCAQTMQKANSALNATENACG